jgi:uncharacterized protein (TIGR03435 family)
MADLAMQLPGWGRARIDRPVVDLTGIKGPYDFTLQWTMPNGGRGDGPRADGAPAAPAEPGTTIFAALDQVGLKLEARKHPMSVIFVDHAERDPTGN